MNDVPYFATIIKTLVPINKGFMIRGFLIGSIEKGSIRNITLCAKNVPKRYYNPQMVHGS